MPKLLPVEASIFWVKQDDEMVGAVLARARIVRLDGLDQPAGKLDVVGAGYAGKVGDAAKLRRLFVDSRFC